MHLVLLSQYLEAQHRAYLSLIVVRSQSDGRSWQRELCAPSLPDRLLNASYTLLYGILTLTLGGRDYDHPLYIGKKKMHCGEVDVPKGVNDRLSLHPGSSSSKSSVLNQPPTAPAVEVMFGLCLSLFSYIELVSSTCSKSRTFERHVIHFLDHERDLCNSTTPHIPT